MQYFYSQTSSKGFQTTEEASCPPKEKSSTSSMKFSNFFFVGFRTYFAILDPILKHLIVE
jgi:hypothetical protein